MDPLPESALDSHGPMTGCIRYRNGSGRVKDWFVWAHPERDNEETLRAHLHRYLPAAEFIGWCIKGRSNINNERNSMPGEESQRAMTPGEMSASERLVRAVDAEIRRPQTTVDSAPRTAPRPPRQTRTVRFIKRKETPGTIVFQEQPDEGQPDVIGNLYVKKWWAGSATSIIVTVEKE